MAQGLASALFGKNSTWRCRVPYGTTFPAAPQVCEIFFKYTAALTDGSLYIYLGAARPGTTSGWFKLDNAYYAA